MMIYFPLSKLTKSRGFIIVYFIWWRFDGKTQITLRRNRKMLMLYCDFTQSLKEGKPQWKTKAKLINSLCNHNTYNISRCWYTFLDLGVLYVIFYTVAFWFYFSSCVQFLNYLIIRMLNSKLQVRKSDILNICETSKSF